MPGIQELAASTVEHPAYDAQPIADVRARALRYQRGRRRGTLALVAASVVVVLGVGIAVSAAVGGGHTSRVQAVDTPTTITVPTSGAVAAHADWTRLPTDESLFPTGSEVTDMVSWRGELYAVGDNFGVGVAGVEPAVWTSHDGSHWKRVWDAGEVSLGSASQQHLLGTPGRLLLFDSHNSAGLMWSSNDGRTWKKSPQPWGNLPLTAIALGGQTYVAIAGGGGAGTSQVWTSTDGTQWQRSTFDFSGAVLTSISTPDGVFTMGGSDAAFRVGVPTVWTSSDGEQWTKQVITKQPGWVTAVAGGKDVVIVATAMSDGRVGRMWSSTGTGWRSAARGGTDKGVISRVFNGLFGGFIAVPVEGNRFLYSVDGIARRGRVTWRETNPGPSAVASIDGAFPASDGLFLFAADESGETPWRVAIGPTAVGAPPKTAVMPETTGAPTTTVDPSLDPSDGPGPGASPCWPSNAAVPTVRVGSADNVSSPRCLIIRGNQHLRIENLSIGATITASLGTHMKVTVPPQGSATFSDPVGRYLAPGLHFVDGTNAVIWVDGPGS